jgi:hypothetical protein
LVGSASPTVWLHLVPCCADTDDNLHRFRLPGRERGGRREEAPGPDHLDGLVGGEPPGRAVRVDAADAADAVHGVADRLGDAAHLDGRSGEVGVRRRGQPDPAALGSNDVLGRTASVPALTMVSAGASSPGHRGGTTTRAGNEKPRMKSATVVSSPDFPLRRFGAPGRVSLPNARSPLVNPCPPSRHQRNCVPEMASQMGIERRKRGATRPTASRHRGASRRRTSRQRPRACAITGSDHGMDHAGTAGLRSPVGEAPSGSVTLR